MIPHALILFAGLLAATSVVAGESQDSLKAFPEAEAQMTRHVLHLEPREHEAGLRIEVIVGRMVEVDAVNRYFFGGRIEPRNIEGWGFTRYVVDTLGPMGGTLMAPEPGAPTAPRFVALRGEPYLVRYNSRLPIVVYVPVGSEVRYRLWQAEPESSVVPQG